MDRLTKYRVWMESVPGHYEQYSGKVDVFAEDTDQARERAFRELQRTAFPDRSAAMWRVLRIEVIK